MSGATPACRIKINPAGDWQIVPPAGQITQIGDAGVTSRGLVANDDLFVSGKLEVDGILRADGTLHATAEAYIYGQCYVSGTHVMAAQNNQIEDRNVSGSLVKFTKLQEETTIAVGFGVAGVNTAGNLAAANSVIVAVAVRVTQAPGGGATTFDVGRTGGNTDEFIQNLGVALGITGTSAANGDGVNPGPVHNAANNTFVITTDANVTVSDMKVRICVWHRRITPPIA